MVNVHWWNEGGMGVGVGNFIDQRSVKDGIAQPDGKKSLSKLLNGVTSWRAYSGVTRGCVNRIRLWPLRRDEHSGVLIGAAETWRFDWPARVWSNDISMKIDQLHAYRDKWKLAATATCIHFFPYT